MQVRSTYKILPPLTADSPAAAVAFPKLQECRRNLGWRMGPKLAQEWHAISAGETHSVQLMRTTSPDIHQALLPPCVYEWKD